VFEFGASHKKLDYLDPCVSDGTNREGPIADLPTLIPPRDGFTKSCYRLVKMVQEHHNAADLTSTEQHAFAIH